MTLRYDPKLVKVVDPSKMESLLATISEDCLPEPKQKLIQVLSQYHSVFATPDDGLPRPMKIAPQKVGIKSNIDKLPPSQQKRFIKPSNYEAIQAVLDSGAWRKLSPSETPLCISNFHVVAKPNTTKKRVCLDARQANEALMNLFTIDERLE